MSILRDMEVRGQQATRLIDLIIDAEKLLKAYKDVCKRYIPEDNDIPAVLAEKCDIICVELHAASRRPL